MADHYLAGSFTTDHNVNLNMVDRALAVNPSDLAYLQKAEIYRRMTIPNSSSDLAQAAMASAKEAIERNPFNPYNHYYLAELYAAGPENNGDFNDQGIKSAQNAIRLFPKYPEAHLLLGRFYLRTGRSKAAKDELRLAVAYGNRAGAVELLEKMSANEINR